jgi:hypothetical protein
MIKITEINTTRTAYSDGVGFLDGGKNENIHASWSNVQSSGTAAEQDVKKTI